MAAMGATEMTIKSLSLLAALALAGCSSADVGGVAGGIMGGLLCGPAAVICGPVLGHALANAAYQAPVTVTADALAGHESRLPDPMPAIGISRAASVAVSE